MGFFDRFKSKLERDLLERREKKAKTASAARAVPPRERASESREPAPAATVRVSRTGAAYRILSHPLVTEKSAVLAEGSTYVFVVPLHVTKPEVNQAVYEVYGIRPRSVRVIRRIGKRVRFGRVEGTRKSWKKAIVTMPKGKTLPIYE
ncbi:50S ribosomal protein L23 [Candidatus Uhrbacteria bacterium]|nr:50S ribosomal protein L23 [Candidatus Uhrbacteria bacterium]